MCILAHKVTILVSHNFLMNHCKKFLSFPEAKATLYFLKQCFTKLSYYLMVELMTKLLKCLNFFVKYVLP